MIPEGDYRYEIVKAGVPAAIETTHLAGGRLRGEKRSVDGTNRYQVEAELDSEGRVRRLELRYQRGPFARSAVYEAQGELFRGSLTALSGRNDVQTKLGRYREVDADLLLFKALIISHVRARGQLRWTGRVATIDPNTLVATSPKQTYARVGNEGRLWSCEPVLGERESIEIDAEGRLLRRVDARGVESRLAQPPREK